MPKLACQLNEVRVLTPFRPRPPACQLSSRHGNDQLRPKWRVLASKSPKGRGVQHRKLARLSADIDKAADRLLRTDDDLMDILLPRLREMRQDRDRVASELNSQKRQNNVADVDRIVSESLSWLNEVNDVIRQGTPQERRDVLLSLVDTITVEFEQEQRGSRTFSKITGAVIEYNKRIRGDRTAIELFRSGVIRSSAQLSLACQVLTTMPSQVASGSAIE